MLAGEVGASSCKDGGEKKVKVDNRMPKQKLRHLQNIDINRANRFEAQTEGLDFFDTMAIPNMQQVLIKLWMPYQIGWG